MKTINKLLFLLPISFEYVFAYDMEHGKELYNSSKCYECHNPSDYTSDDRKAKNYKQLLESVDACRYSTNADWFDEDRDDVVHYLNKEFYKYETTK